MTALFEAGSTGQLEQAAFRPDTGYATRNRERHLTAQLARGPLCELADVPSARMRPMNMNKCPSCERRYAALGNTGEIFPTFPRKARRARQRS